MTFNERTHPDWIREVVEARRNIIVSKRSATQMLKDLFELYQDDFDVTCFQTNMPRLYSILQEFCSKLPMTHKQLGDNSKEIVLFFNENQDAIRRLDIEMYYCLLNFIDYLRCQHIYFG